MCRPLVKVLARHPDGSFRKATLLCLSTERNDPQSKNPSLCCKGKMIGTFHLQESYRNGRVRQQSI